MACRLMALCSVWRLVVVCFLALGFQCQAPQVVGSGDNCSWRGTGHCGHVSSGMELWACCRWWDFTHVHVCWCLARLFAVPCLIAGHLLERDTSGFVSDSSLWRGVAFPSGGLGTCESAGTTTACCCSLAAGNRSLPAKLALGQSAICAGCWLYHARYQWFQVGLDQTANHVG